MVRHLIPILIISLNCLGQTKIDAIKVKKDITDTINYTYMMRFQGWSLTKVLDNNSKSLYNCNPRLAFTNNIDSTTIRSANFNSKILLKQNDTLIDIFWYQTKHNGCVKEICGHYDYIWKLKLNKTTNIIVVDRLFCLKNSKVNKLFFKVYKFSEHEIILEDMNVKPIRRIYYFQKNI